MTRKLFRLARAHPWMFTAAVLFAAATTLTGIGLMGTSGYLISRAAQRPMLVDLFMVTAAVRFFGISRAVVRYAERIFSHDFTFRLLADMRNLLFRSLSSRSLDWLMARRPGDMLARLVSDIQTLQNYYLRIIIPALAAIMVVAITVTCLWVFSPVLAATTLTFLIIGGFIVPVLAMHFSKANGQKMVELQATMKACLVDQLQGIQELHWMGQKHHSSFLIGRLQEQLNLLQQKNAGLAGMLEGLHHLVSYMGMFAVLAMAVPMVLSGKIQGVMLAMLALGVLSSFEAVQNLGNAFQNLGAYKKAGHRILDIPGSPTDPSGPEINKGNPFIGDIEFEGVNFSYGAEHITVNDISFTISAGTKTAIVGPTGCGKSTLANLLLRFWEPQSGNIIINGLDIRSISTESFRSLFSVVVQDTYIFNRTLRENLLLSSPQATDEQLRVALEQVNLSGFAPLLDMELGNLGMRLSGGERKLLALARAYLKNAPIWVLDEPTSHLDVVTERKILNSVANASTGRTVILITHRLVDMQEMDQIIVMDKGHIVEKGTHRQLIDAKGFYSRLLAHQQNFKFNF